MALLRIYQVVHELDIHELAFQLETIVHDDIPLMFQIISELYHLFGSKKICEILQ